MTLSRVSTTTFYQHHTGSSTTWSMKVAHPPKRTTLNIFNDQRWLNCWWGSGTVLPANEVQRTYCYKHWLTTTWSTYTLDSPWGRLPSPWSRGSSTLRPPPGSWYEERSSQQERNIAWLYFASKINQERDDQGIHRDHSFNTYIFIYGLNSHIKHSGAQI